MPSPVNPALMARAIELSRLGYPAPNPHVGCVIEFEGEIVGEGFHEFAGGPHAEVSALAQAGPRARGATAYVSLEPCNHQGRTGPCSEALIAAGVSRVIFALQDPHLRASGGAQRLANAGILVESGVLANEAREANLSWMTAMERSRPFVVGKSASSLDGRIALPNGQSRWITGPLARTKGQELRARCGSVLVGRRTVMADNPQLTVRELSVQNQPTRLILDPNRSLSPDFHVFDSSAPTIRIVNDRPSPNELMVESDAQGINLQDLLKQLFERGLTGVLVEGGAATLSGFVKAGLVDRLELFIAPKILGAGTSWLTFPGLDSVESAPRWSFRSVEQMDQDLWITAVPIG